LTWVQVLDDAQLMIKPSFPGSGRTLLIALILLVVISFPARSVPGAVFPNKPRSRVAIVDEADMIAGDDYSKIHDIIEKTLNETAIPIVVVTIERMSRYGAAGMSIEQYARALFDNWGIGHPTVSVAGKRVARNLGVLLLVSKGDRKARIELGADWARDKDDACNTIMQDYIVASFKRGEFSTGIRAGVEALSAMVSEKKLPSVPRPAWHYLLMIGFVGLGIFTIISLIRRGSSGWAWLFWGVVFSIVGFVLYQMLSSRRGGFGGGSFGGGFSGGGGATGSW
jgi:uncharacterized protein